MRTLVEAPTVMVPSIIERIITTGNCLITTLFIFICPPVLILKGVIVNPQIRSVACTQCTYINSARVGKVVSTMIYTAVVAVYVYLSACITCRSCQDYKYRYPRREICAYINNPAVTVVPAVHGNSSVNSPDQYQFGRNRYIVESAHAFTST